MSNGCPMDVHGTSLGQMDWTGLDSGTSLLSEHGMSIGHPMDVHGTGGLDRTVGPAW